MTCTKDYIHVQKHLPSYGSCIWKCTAEQFISQYKSQYPRYNQLKYSDMFTLLKQLYNLELPEQRKVLEDWTNVSNTPVP